MASYMIRVINRKDEDPIKGVRVRIDLHDMTTKSSKEVYTDAQGLASLDVMGEGVSIVYLDGFCYGEHYYREGELIVIRK
jgi:hypothetical protein